LDRSRILGVYLAQGSGGAGRLIASVVDVPTGQLLGNGHAVTLEDTKLQTVGAALNAILEESGWLGVVGVGLPGVLQHTASAGSDSSAAPLRMTGDARRHARSEMETYLQEATGKELVVLSGAGAVASLAVLLHLTRRVFDQRRTATARWCSAPAARWPPRRAWALS
jgi:hypothetical protein